MDDPAYSDTSAQNPRVVRRHRIRHTKSRNGCYPCKLRRVKCDELQPACGTCASRGEPCSYPLPHVPSGRPPRSKGKATVNKYGAPWSDAFGPSDRAPPLDATLPAIFSSHHSHTRVDLPMNDLKLLQFFNSYTAKQMSPHPRRTIVWQRIIPEIACNHRYLMHLLLALGGIHMITQHEANRTSGSEDLDTVDLAIVMEHHQIGLEGFREKVSSISPSNAEALLTGSVLLVAFAFASLMVQELNPLDRTLEEMNNPTGTFSSANDVLRFNWLYLNRGVTSILHEQWDVLKSSRLRQMLVFSQHDECWKDLPFAPPPSRLSRCSPRLVKFAEGASQAVANIKASLRALEPARDRLSSCSGTPTSLLSESSTIDSVVDAHSETMDILDTLYTRILSILRCEATDNPADTEIQLDFEEAAILAWPTQLPSPFLASLERGEPNYLRGHSLVILAHFYLASTLLDTWFLRGAFEREILKVNTLIGSLNESQLSTFMLWPNEVVASTLKCTP
ncbi:uncharacterized protein N7487_006018 [Penicillium crustosum]|uniref:uncharacterized protein n=1 Tax=Penicillium crustosum TaxID=36656 RepID=UPI00239D9C45|nr:uncharacterized protein N7487_006018 [Penicillium crustosum]KAJ5411659.1 hypothetical protein N7487_006018 [Penicillium crustosum]